VPRLDLKYIIRLFRHTFESQQGSRQDMCNGALHRRYLRNKEFLGEPLRRTGEVLMKSDSLEGVASKTSAPGSQYVQRYRRQ